MANPFSQDGLKRALAASTVPATTETAQDTKSSSGVGWGPYAALIGGNLADSASTWAALSSGRGREANGALPSSAPSIMGLKMAASVPEALVMKYLGDHGHPTLGKALGYGIGALGAGLAAHNSQVGR